MSAEKTSAFVKKTLKNKNYQPRCIDSIVDLHLQAFGAVEIAGTMWSGKTWTSEAHASSEISLITPEIIQTVQADSRVALVGDKPHLIDEWQEVPALWDAVRHACDEAGREKGLFLLSGSSRPSKEEVHHSGAGRISRLRMWPMSLYESGHSDGNVSLQGLFDGNFKPFQTTTDLASLATLICRGGWPNLLNASDKVARLIPGQYLEAVIESIATKENRSPDELRGILRSLARNLGGAVTLKTLAKDTSLMLSNDRPNAPVLERWLSALKQRFVIDDLPGWDAPIKSPARLRRKPKRCFADPSLPAELLGMTPKRLLENGQIFGQLFEELCLRDLRVYASCLDGAPRDPLRYYRDSDGLEVDAIIELFDGRWGAIEVKLGANKVDEAVWSLTRLKNKIANNPRAHNPEPSFMAVLVGKTNFCYQTPDGVYVVPITSLRP